MRSKNFIKGLNLGNPLFFRLSRNSQKYGETENLYLADFYFSFVIPRMMMFVCATCEIHVRSTPEESKMALDEGIIIDVSSHGEKCWAIFYHCKVGLLITNKFSRPLWQISEIANTA